MPEETTEAPARDWLDLQLREDHVRMLVSSGITPGVAAGRGYRSISASEAPAVLGQLKPTPFSRRHRHAGLLIPLHGVGGGVVGHELRPDVDVVGKDGDPKKYLRPSGARSQIDCPPAMRPLLSDVTVPVVVTEGAKKADAAASRGILCLALQGVACWTSNDGTALEAWRDVPLSGRQVAICYDGDYRTNEEVRRHARALAKYLSKRRGARVRFIVLPETAGVDKVGLDDWLAANPDAGPDELMALARDELTAPGEDRGGRAEILATDLHVADEWVLRYVDRCRFRTDTGTWLGYDRGVWNAQSGQAIARANLQDMVRDVWAYSIRTDKHGEQVKVDETTWLYSASRLRSVLDQAAANSRVQINPDLLDADPYLFNAANATIDLRTGKERDHNPGDLITMGSTVHYEPDSTCPEFDKFLLFVLPDEEVRSFVQRLLGMAMLGVVTEHILPVFHGSGRNGKGTLIRLSQAVFGTYYTGISRSLLVETRYEEHATTLATLHKKRLATTEETAEASRWNTALVKTLTGGDNITARFMHQDEFTFTPAHTLILATNHTPKVSDKDEAFWARARLVPFTQRFENPDASVEERMRTRELPGILNWLLQGCQDYLRDGLGEPTAVAAATASYRAGENLLGRFISEHYEVTGDPDDVVPLSEVRETFDHWRERQVPKVKPIARNVFGPELAKAAGIDRPEKTGKANITVFRCLRLIDPDAVTESDPFSGTEVSSPKGKVSSPEPKVSSPDLGRPEAAPAADQIEQAHQNPANSLANSLPGQANSRRTHSNDLDSGNSAGQEVEANQANQANSLLTKSATTRETGGNAETWSTTETTFPPVSSYTGCVPASQVRLVRQVRQTQAAVVTDCHTPGARSPIDNLLGDLRDPVMCCSQCGTSKQLVPPGLFWFACPACHPATFHRD